MQRGAILSVLGFFALLSVVTTALTVYPFHPYTVYSSEVVPPVACPGEKVNVRGDSELEAGWTVSRIEVESTWTDVDTGNRVGGGTGTVYDPEPRGRSLVTSDIVRDAPDEPGRYRLETMSNVYGTFGGSVFSGWPKAHEEDYASEDVTTVLDPNRNPNGNPNGNDGRCG